MKPVEKKRRAQSRDVIEDRLNSHMPTEVQRPPHVKESEDAPTKTRKTDPLSDSLGCDSYYHRMVWPIWFVENINGLNYKLVVDRYYHQKKIAIDLNLDNEGRSKIPIKQKLLGEHGIHYFHLTGMDDVHNMLAKVAEQ